MTSTAVTHADLAARHASVLPDWVRPSYREPIALVEGSGRHVRDAEGRSYLDFYAGVLTTMIGSAIPEVVDALEAAIRRGMLHSSTAYLIEPQVRLAERIADLSGIPDARCYFTNSGTEAVDAALLLATEHRRTGQVLALRNGYHGRSFGAVAVTGHSAWRATHRSPLAVAFLPGYLRTAGDRHLDDAAFVARSLAETRLVLDTCVGGPAAALLAEPIQGVGGFTVPPPGWFQAIVPEVATRTGALLVADETQTGWGRTGETFWAIQHEGVAPDVMTFAKGLGNGLAVGGLVGRSDVVNALSAGSTSTFGGNHLAMTGALAVLDVIETRGLQANARVLGAQILDALRSGTTALPAVADVRGRGLMIGLEIVDPADGSPAPGLAAAVHESARERGLLIGRGGFHQNALRIGPPLTLTADEAVDGTERLLDALHAALPV